MLKEILEKITNEVLCPEAKAIAKKIGNLSGNGTIECKKSGNLFTVEKDTSVIGGFITVKNQKGKLVELDLCGNTDYEVK